jgi:Tfp pilus assembly protein PilN
VIIIGSIHIKTYRRYKLLKKELMESGKKLSGIQKNVKKTTQDEKYLRAMKRKRAKMEKQKKIYRDIISFLTVTSSLIPGQTWLDRFLYNKKEVVIEGYSPSYQQVLKFYTNLAKIPILKHCCLKYNQKADLFRFEIKSDLDGAYKRTKIC